MANLEQKIKTAKPAYTLENLNREIHAIAMAHGSNHTTCYAQHSIYQNGKQEIEFKAYIGSKGIIVAQTIDELLTRARRAFTPVFEDILLETPNPHGDDNYSVPENAVL